MNITKTNINPIIEEIFHNNVKAGWYTDVETGKRRQRNIPEMLMLMVSEIAEGMEAYRKNLSDDKLPEHPGIAVEMADLFIRMADILGYLRELGMDIDFDHIVFEKRHYNAKRADHQLANRKEVGGKAF